MPAKISVTKKHFDPAETQIVMRLFLEDRGYRAGDTTKTLEFRLWVDARAREFKKMHGLGVYQPATALGASKWIDYLKRYVRGFDHEQLNLFEEAIQ